MAQDPELDQAEYPDPTAKVTNNWLALYIQALSADLKSGQRQQLTELAQLRDSMHNVEIRVEKLEAVKLTPDSVTWIRTSRIKDELEVESRNEARDHRVRSLVNALITAAVVAPASAVSSVSLSLLAQHLR